MSTVERPAVSQKFELKGSAGFEAWRSRVGNLFDVSLASGVDASRFSAAFKTWQLSNAIVSQVSTATAQQLRRDSERIQRQPVDYVVLYLCNAGRLRVEHASGVSELQAGDLIFSDYMETSISHVSDFANISIMLDRQYVPNIFRNGSLHGQILSANNGATRVLSAYMQSICQRLDKISLSSADGAVRGILELAASLWSKDVQRGGPGARPGHLLYDAMTLVRAELENADLSADLIASRLDISRTQLFDLFKPQGGVRRAILNLRLEQAFKTLLLGRESRGFVSAVAFRLAFKSEAHFTRAFVQRFGCTPSRVVAAQVRDEAATLYGARMLMGQGVLDATAVEAWLRSVCA